MVNFAWTFIKISLLFFGYLAKQCNYVSGTSKTKGPHTALVMTLRGHLHRRVHSSHECIFQIDHLIHNTFNIPAKRIPDYIASGRGFSQETNIFVMSICPESWMLHVVKYLWETLSRRWEILSSRP